MDEEYYMRFPSVLREALMSGRVSFKQGTKFAYAPFLVYRGITREPGESLAITRNDFLSYAELGKKPRGLKNPGISLYSCSCFVEKDELLAALKLPRFNKKIIFGELRDTYGPQRTNLANKHVDWWIYEQAEFEHTFKVI